MSTERERKIPNTRKGEIMKTMNEINTIICEMSDEQFEILQNAEFDAWDLDSRISRNGKRRLAYNLRKVGLTVAEWDAWGDRD